MKMAHHLSPFISACHLPAHFRVLLIKGRKADWFDICAHTLVSEAFVTGRLLTGSDEKHCLSYISGRQNESLTKKN